MDAKVRNYAGWQSDVIVDLIKRLRFSLHHAQSRRELPGLHDSRVNYGDNQPPMMLCTTKDRVQIAHGYAPRRPQSRWW